MKKEDMEFFVRGGFLRARQPDASLIRSMVESAEINAGVAKKIHLDENSATLVFREVYESVRQLGDAMWWSIGYEPLSHEASMDILKDADVKEKVKLNHIFRFKNMRNDANYRGFRISVEQAKEILEFWDTVGKEIARKIKSKLQKK